MPAILILGFDLEITRVMLVAVLGGLLGILMMIPLRRGADRGAARRAQVSRRARPAPKCSRPAPRTSPAPLPASRGAAARCGSRCRQPAPRTIFTGFGIGLALQDGRWSRSRAGRTSRERSSARPSRAARSAAEISPELLGVGYIIGPRIASIMCAGGVLAYLVLIPLIKFFGDALSAAARARHQLDQRNEPEPDSRRLRPLHRRRRGGRRRHHQPVALAADHLARPAGRACATSAARDARASCLRTEQDIPMKWVARGRRSRSSLPSRLPRRCT
ncbi:MAG: hypothetical protein MZV49_05545 [Rhodopseudomonas palustris]|nr:hypothetical protein [Rhodopseudomonas palustris]